MRASIPLLSDLVLPRFFELVRLWSKAHPIQDQAEETRQIVALQQVLATVSEETGLAERARLSPKQYFWREEISFTDLCYIPFIVQIYFFFKILLKRDLFANVTGDERLQPHLAAFESWCELARNNEYYMKITERMSHWPGKDASQVFLKNGWNSIEDFKFEQFFADYLELKSLKAK